MIVFLKDWNYYPNAIVDTKTPNKSFLRMARLFKEMGVEHYYFHLALLQPALQGVDPHSETLTVQEKAMILYECDNNPWYYLREIVLDKGAGPTLDDCRYRANRANIAAMWLTLACIDYIQIQPRQTGKSFGSDVNTLWLMYFCYRNTTINLITKDETLRKSNIARMKKIRDMWPDWLNRNTKRDDNNQMSMSCHELENKFYTNVSQSSEKAANNMARGMTSPKILVDEGPFINHIETTISAAMGSTNTARDIARRNHKPYGTVFTTTAGNKEDRDGKYMFGLWSDAAVWTEKFYDCPNRDVLIELIKRNSLGRAVMVNLTMSHTQLGLTDEWLYEAIANARSESDNIERDYFNTWTSSGQGTLIPPELAKMVRASELDPVDLWISNDNYIFRWYEPIAPSEHYLIGLDTSDAIGRDDIACTLVNIRSGKVAGAATFNETNLIRFAKWLLEFMVKYTNSTLIIERRYNAQTIIDYLLLKLPEYHQDPFKRMYNALVQEGSDRLNKVQREGLNRPTYLYDEFRNQFGFNMGKDSRKLLYNNTMMNAVKYAGTGMRDKTLISQILNLEIRNNRIDHAAGGHDDTVISWLMPQWLLNHGVNLDLYGIDNRLVLADRDREQTDRNPVKDYEKMRRDRQRADVERLHAELKETDDPFDILRLESELTKLTSTMSSGDESDNDFSLDQLLTEAREARENRYFGGNTSGHGRPMKKAHALLERFG